MSNTLTSLIQPAVADMLTRLDQLEADLDKRLKDRPGTFMDAATSHDFELLEAVDDLRGHIKGLESKAVFQTREPPAAERKEQRRRKRRVTRSQFMEGQ